MGWGEGYPECNDVTLCILSYWMLHGKVQAPTCLHQIRVSGLPSLSQSSALSNAAERRRGDLSALLLHVASMSFRCMVAGGGGRKRPCKQQQQRQPATNRQTDLASGNYSRNQGLESFPRRTKNVAHTDCLNGILKRSGYIRKASNRRERQHGNRKEGERLCSVHTALYTGRSLCTETCARRAPQCVSSLQSVHLPLILNLPGAFTENLVSLAECSSKPQSPTGQLAFSNQSCKRLCKLLVCILADKCWGRERDLH